MNSTPATAIENLSKTETSATKASAKEDTSDIAGLNARYCALDPEHTMCKYVSKCFNLMGKKKIKTAIMQTCCQI